MTAPGNTGPRAGGATDRERTGYVTREEQYRALVDHMRRRDRRVARAIVTVLSDARPTVLASVGEVLGFVANQAWHDVNQARLDADRTIDAFRQAARGAQ